MNKLILAIKKRFLLPSVLAISVCFWLALCRSHYESYWNSTIYKVQTVDFNLLHHSLPITLSELILAGKDEEIQRVLDSTYGIFGLVITDPSGNEILFKTKAFYKKKTWQKYISLPYLRHRLEAYDCLYNPPLLSGQYFHASPRIDKATKYKTNTSNKVIGRVYYIRGVPPEFKDDLCEAVFSNWFEMSGSKRGYILLTLIVIGFSLAFVFLIGWRKRVLAMQEQELKAQVAELAIRRKALNQLNMDLAAQRNRKEWLEQEAELAYQRALRLKDALIKLQEAFCPEEYAANNTAQPVNVRPPLYKASTLMADVESLLPELNHNAKVLRSQAEVWQSYCLQLESRQAELQKLLEQRNVSLGSHNTYVSAENHTQMSQI